MPNRIKFSETYASKLLDLLRGLAALIVLLEHWRSYFFVDYHDVYQRNVFIKLFYLVTGGGHQAVVIFFVLSGYLVSGSVIRAWQENRWSWLEYFEHRLVRLWTVLLPALVLVCLLDHIGLANVRAHSLYFGTHDSNMVHDAGHHLGPLTFLGNVLFLQTIVTNPYGSDAALWSLSYEFWYYVLFPLTYVALLSRGRWLSKLGLIVSALLVAGFVGPRILIAFPIWLMGVMLHYLPVAKQRVGLLLATLIFYLPLVFARNMLNADIQSLLLGAATATTIWLILGLRNRARESSWVEGSRLLANFSYTLYLVHMSLLMLVAGMWLGTERLQPTCHNILITSPLLLAVLGFSYCLATVTEFQNEAIRYRVHRAFIRIGTTFYSTPKSRPKL